MHPGVEALIEFIVILDPQEICMNSSVRAISFYLPEKVITNEDIIGEFPIWTYESLERKIGISKRHISEKEILSSDLAFESAKKLFIEYSVDPEEIDFLIFCSQSPDYFLPTTACLLQDRLGLPTTAGALDINLGCSGFVYCLSFAKGLIETGQAKNVLLLTAETYSKFMHRKDKSCKAIFSDGAAATLISSSSDHSYIGPFLFGTDGRGKENLIVRKNGLRTLFSDESTEYSDSGNLGNTDGSLLMNGQEIFAFTLKNIPDQIRSLLEKAGMTDKDIDLYIFHQASYYMLESLRMKMEIPPEKFYYCLSETGNTVSSTIPIALKHAIVEGKIKGGSTVLISGFGVGYSWASAVLKF
jgi:3-oxoacyl-[acyl-carrier-protein] synthase-3